MILSIRNVSRFGAPAILLAWFAVFIGVFANIGFRRLGVLVPVIWLGGGMAALLPFRCPRCHGSTISPGGGFFGSFLAPFWTPQACPRCRLDFRDKTFWSPGNRKLRADWLMLTGKGVKSPPRPPRQPG